MIVDACVCVFSHIVIIIIQQVFGGIFIYLFSFLFFCFLGGFSLWAIFGWQAQYYLKHHILCTFCLTLAINYAALENLFIYMLTLASSLCQRKRFANHPVSDFYFLFLHILTEIKQISEDIQKKVKNK